MDFYGYWHEKREAEKYPYAVSTISFNTTFYFQDNAPGSGHLRFVKDGHLIEPEHLYPLDRPKFEAWCEAQKHVILHPMAGDCVVFMNHIPHQGAKEHDDMEHSNVVCHYQVTPMHEVVSICLSTTGVRWNFPIYQLTLSSKEVRATRYYDIILTGNCGITGLKEIFGVADFYGHQVVPHVTGVLQVYHRSVGEKYGTKTLHQRLRTHQGKFSPPLIDGHQMVILK